MRINRFIARSTGMSRRSADKAVEQGRVAISGRQASHGDEITNEEQVTLDGVPVSTAVSNTLTLVLNKPPGYVCSRNGQGSRTIYDLLPPEHFKLKPVGRLDKDSSGLLLLTNDGELANKLTHPKFEKTKVYKIALNKPLNPLDRQMISGSGVKLDDGLSKLQLERINDTDNVNWKVTMHEGRNRQIRRTFEALGYSIPKLHRTAFGPYKLNGLATGEWQEL